jgi:tartrate-resistant acid phosphatase type 5
MSAFRFSIDRRTLLTGASAAIGAGLLPRVPAEAQAPSLAYVAIGDWGRGGADDQYQVAAQLGKRAAAIGSRFTLSLGDNFYEDGVADTEDPQWLCSFEAIYTAPALQRPWHVILGNHDYRGSVEAQLAYGAKSRRWRMPSRYYKRTEEIGGGVRADYFHLDTSPFVLSYRGTKVAIDGQDPAVQLNWLERELAASQAAWKIVIGHHPVFTVAGGDKNTKELIELLHPLLLRHGVHVYVNGHIHNQQYLEVDGIHYITTGAGSQALPVPPFGSGQFTSDAHGFMSVEHSADAFRFALLDEAGKVLFHKAVTGA